MEQQMLAALDWYRMAGVDEVINATPRNYLEAPQSVVPVESATPVKPTPTQPVRPVMPATAPTVLTSPIDAIQEAKKLADAADSLEALYDAIANFDGCPLKKTAMHTVTHDGTASGDVMIIGEAPGADEDRRGIPFCGVSGQLLDKMLASIGYYREKNLYISNMIFWRPPGNRNPTPEELAICRPFVEKHIALVQPKLLLLVGGVAAKDMLNATVGITRLRGKLHTYRQDSPAYEVPAMATLHPSYLLRQPGEKRLAWSDMLMVKEQLR